MINRGLQIDTAIGGSADTGSSDQWSAPKILIGAPLKATTVTVHVKIAEAV